VPAINIARRDPNPRITFRRIRSTIDVCGAKQPREVLRWLVQSIGVGRIGVDAGWWDIQQIVDRAQAALDVDGEGTDDANLSRALTEIKSTCDYHLNVQ